MKKKKKKKYDKIYISDLSAVLLWMYVKYKFTFLFSSSRNWTRKASLARIPEIQENFLGLRWCFVLKVFQLASVCKLLIKWPKTETIMIYWFNLIKKDLRVSETVFN